MDQRFELGSLQRTDSLCCPNPQTELLRNLKNKCFDDFEETLKKATRKDLVDVNHFYEDPENKSLLDIACSSPGNVKFVDLLLRHGADVNRINIRHKKAPLHFAVQYADLDVVKVLVENNKTDVNLLDASGNTALHLAILYKRPASFVQQLLKNSAIRVCKTNRKCQTPLHIALWHKNLEICSLLLKRVDVDLDGIRDFAHKTCRDMIKSTCPELEMSVTPKITTATEPEHDNLFSYLYFRDTKSFLSRIKARQSRIDDDDGKYTFLQYACDYGLTDVAEALVQLGADPNKTCPSNYRTPILLAAYKGYHEIIRILVETNAVSFEPLYSETVLHAVVRGIRTCQRELPATSQVPQDHRKCLMYLLNEVPPQKLYINMADEYKETVLYYAVKANDVELIRLLLEKGAYLGCKNGANEMPIRFMNAKTLEQCFDDSIEENDQLTGAENYEIIYKYDIFAPPKVYTPEDQKSAKFSSETGLVDEYEIVSETEPLVEMSKVPELRPLLKHPLVTSFLNLKWYTIRKYFWANVVFYVLFWLLLTVYVLSIYKPSASESPNANATGRPDDVVATAANRSRGAKFMWALMLVFSALLFVREFFQFSISPWRYIRSAENWLETGLIAASFVILLGSAKSNNIKAQIAAVAILLSWTELVLLVGRHPLLSTNIEMFKVVTCNFLKFLAWYSILILAFAISFYLLFRDNETNNDVFFRNPLMSIFKSVIMLTGEFEVGNIPFGSEPNANHLLFVLFVFLIAIVLFNLLNGLAVSDTQVIRMNAELVGIICRAKLITYIETMAAGDPFSYLNVFDRITCFCCCLPCGPRRGKFVSRRKRRRNIPGFYRNISLFPRVFPENQVPFRPNQNNRVIMPNSKGDEHFNKCFSSCNWKIDDPAVVESTKHIITKNKLSNQIDVSSQNDVTKYSEQLKEYEEKFKSLEESSKRTEQKLSEIMTILKQRL